MFTPQIPLADYLTILSSATPEDHPYTDHETHAAELGEAFTALAKGVVAFVTVGKEALGYEVVRSTLEDLVHTFPAQEDGNVPGQEDPFAALLALLAGELGVDPALIDEEGNISPDALPDSK